MSGKIRTGKKKPKFRRQHHGEKVKLGGKSWKKPRGLHAKLRLRKKGHRIHISVGYKNDTVRRGLTREGLVPTQIVSVSQLKGLDSKRHGIMLSSSMGFKKKAGLIEECLKLGFKVLNYSDALKFIAEKRKQLEENKQKKEKKPKKLKTIDEKVKKEEITEEEKAEKEKHEKEKVLTKRQ
jgi:ribosomal protein L32E